MALNQEMLKNRPVPAPGINKPMPERLIKGRGLSEKTKQDVLDMVKGGFSHERIAGILKISEHSIRRALRNDLEPFTQSQVSIIAAALAQQLAVKSGGTYRNSEAFKAAVAAIEGVSYAEIEALFKRVAMYGLDVD